jgi:hypothetical protein
MIPIGAGFVRLVDFAERGRQRPVVLSETRAPGKSVMEFARGALSGFAARGWIGGHRRGKGS